MVDQPNDVSMLRPRAYDRQRIRFAAGLELYDGAVGAVMVIVNLPTRTPDFKDPERLPAGSGDRAVNQ